MCKKYKNNKINLNICINNIGNILLLEVSQIHYEQL